MLKIDIEFLMNILKNSNKKKLKLYFITLYVYLLNISDIFH